MSKIPKVAMLAKPATKVGSEQVATLAHEELMRLVWENIDVIVSTRLSSLCKKVVDTAPKAGNDYTSELKELIGQLERQVSNPRLDAKAREQVEKYIPLCQAHAKINPPKLDEDSVRIDISKTTLERPIVEIKGKPGALREEQVGFIDIECKLSVPVRVNLTSQIRDVIRALEWTHLLPFPKSFKGTEKPEAKWNIETEQRILWIDIRPQLPPVGQLIRELKTLRAYDGYSPTGQQPHAYIWVFTETVEPHIVKMLEQEHFLIFDRAWLKHALATDDE
jgi:hypothetical protein